MKWKTCFNDSHTNLVLILQFHFNYFHFERCLLKVRYSRNDRAIVTVTVIMAVLRGVWNNF